MARASVFLRVSAGQGGLGLVREGGERERTLGGNLLPRTRELGLVHQLETGGKLDCTPGLVSVGTGDDGVAWLAAVCAKPGIKPTTAFFLGECAAEPSGGVYVHGGGGRGGEGLTRGRGVGGSGLDVGLKLRSGRGGVVARASGGVGGGLILLHGDGRRNIRLKIRGGEATTGKFKSDDFFQFVRKFEN